MKQLKRQRPPRAILRSALDGLGDFLLTEYAHAHVFYEADLHHLTVCYLRHALAAGARGMGGRRWVVGSKHRTGHVLPDILVYLAPGHGEIRNFIYDPESYLAAVIEVKYRSGLAQDLGKLDKLQARLQRNGVRVLTWMVYGDHFEPTVHRTNASGAGAIARRIEAWARSDRTRRGATVLCVGLERPADSRMAREVRRHFNEVWWHRDKHAAPVPLPGSS